MSSVEDCAEAELLIASGIHDRLGRFNSSKSRLLAHLVPRFCANLSGYVCIFAANFALWCVLFGWNRSIRGESISEPWGHFSPVLNYTKIPLQSQNIQAKLFPNESDPMAIFAAPPSPAVDKAWHRVSSNMIFGLTQSDVLRLGKDPKTAVKYNPEWNIHSPEDLYLGVLDTFHQVHCLNMLRQNLIINYHYYWGKTFGFRPEAFRERHLSHCTSILLQNIMCHSDLEVVTHVWREGNPVPWPDFGVKKQCRDFDELIKFRDSMDLDDSWEKFRLYTKRPSDAVVLPMEDGLTELMASADEFRDGEYYKDLHIEGCST